MSGEAAGKSVDRSMEVSHPMTIARRPSPFGELLSVRQAMDCLFEDSFVRSPTWANGSHATDHDKAG